MPDPLAPSTVTEAIELLRDRGYTADFDIVDGVLACDPDTRLCSVDQAVVEHLYRFEGPSDPGDEMIVFALVDPASGTKGTLAGAFGLAADPDRIEHLVGLRRRFD